MNNKKKCIFIKIVIFSLFGSKASFLWKVINIILSGMEGVYLTLIFVRLHITDTFNMHLWTGLFNVTH